MLRSEYCLDRAERLRILMLTNSDPTAARRLRGFAQKYKELAERAKKLPSVPSTELQRSATENGHRTKLLGLRWPFRLGAAE